MEPRYLPHLVARTRDRVHAAMAAAYQAGGLADLLPAHGGVLFAAGGGPRSMQELAAMLDRDNSTMTTLVGKLEQRGYLKTHRDPQDRRTRLVELTARGRKARATVRRLSARLARRMYAGLSEREQRTLMELLGRVHGNLSE